jgi:Cu/Ag efflux pump CusA
MMTPPTSAPVNRRTCFCRDDPTVLSPVKKQVVTAVEIPGQSSSWRSTLIICVSIPLSILCSIVVLSALGETINIMTLGGMALAVGILVDDATVEIENIHRNMAEGGTMQE